MEPIFLSSIVISADPRTDGPVPLLSAVKRAVPERAAAVRSPLDRPTVGFPSPSEAEVLITDVVFDRSKAQVCDKGAAPIVSCACLSNVQTDELVNSKNIWTVYCARYGPCQPSTM